LLWKMKDSKEELNEENLDFMLDNTTWRAERT